jgi:predicted transcriptional regulator
VCRETADAEIAELRAALARLKAQQGDLVAREQDLSMMCRRLILALRRTAEDDSADLTLANKSLAWLQSKGLAGSPLRDVHPVRPMSDDDIIEIANEVHRAMPDDADDQQELLAIIHEVFDRMGYVERKPMTPEELAVLWESVQYSNQVATVDQQAYRFARAIEAHHGITGDKS